jgi:ATP/maltotriose-dependent transcriptional regulator MalT
VQSKEPGYLVLTAPAGFGKTALLANLVSASPDAFAYHSFTAAYGQDGLAEDFFLANVVEQIAEWHPRRGELPDGLRELRALYQEFSR